MLPFFDWYDSDCGESSLQTEQLEELRGLCTGYHWRTLNELVDESRHYASWDSSQRGYHLDRVSHALQGLQWYTEPL
jgi:hypothetical protein